MKICPNCGISQSDRRRECVECGALLGEPIREPEERRLRAQQAEQLDKLYNKSDPLHASLFDKLLGCLMLAGLAVIPVVLFFCRGWLKADLLTFSAAVFWAFGAVEAFFPRFGWALEKLRMSFFALGTDDLTPTHFYFVMRKISLVICLLAGAFFFYVMIWEGLHPAPAEPSVIVA